VCFEKLLAILNKVTRHVPVAPKSTFFYNNPPKLEQKVPIAPNQIQVALKFARKMEEVKKKIINQI